MSRIILISIFILFYFSCERSDKDEFCGCTEPLVELEWITELIDLATNSVLPLEKIYKCKYGDIEGFLFAYCINCPDSFAQFQDCDGKVICAFGGLGGLETCPDFWDKVTDYELIWTKE